MSPIIRSMKVLEGINIRRVLEASGLPIDVATAIADLCEFRPEALPLRCPWATVGSHMCREAFAERCQGRGAKKLRYRIGDPRNKPEDDPYEIEQRLPQESSGK